MTGKSHMTVGVVTYASLWAHPIPPLDVPLLAGTHAALALPVALALVLLGSLLPDLDHPEGRLANERILGIPVLKPLSWLIGAVFGHRGATHSLLALAGLVALGDLPFLPWAWAHLGLLLGWGYASHLLADMLTKSGVPLLWPLDWRIGFPPLRALRFTTGTWPEGLVVAVLTLACFANATRAILG
jgi:inner membrane protein